MNEISIIDIAKTIWSKRKIILIWIASGATLGLIFAISKPKEYSVTIQIIPEQTEVGGMSGSMGALAGMIGVNVGSSVNGITTEMYPQVLQSSTFLSEFTNIPVEYDDKKTTLANYLIFDQKEPWWQYILSPSKIFDLFSNSKTLSIDSENTQNPGFQQYKFEGELSKRITLASDKKTNIISIVTTLQDPKIAMQIADSAFLKLNKFVINYKTLKAQHQLQFLTQALDKAKQEYDSINYVYASIADKNRDIILQSSRIKLEDATNQRNLAFAIYSQLASQKEAAQISLQEQKPVLTVLQPARMPLWPSSPNFKLYIIICAFLGGMIITIYQIIKAVYTKK